MFTSNNSVDGSERKAPVVAPAGRSPPRALRPKRRRTSRVLAPGLPESRGWRVRFSSI